MFCRTLEKKEKKKTQSTPVQLRTAMCRVPKKVRSNNLGFASPGSCSSGFLNFQSTHSAALPFARHFTILPIAATRSAHVVERKTHRTRTTTGPGSNFTRTGFCVLLLWYSHLERSYSSIFKRVMEGEMLFATTF